MLKRTMTASKKRHSVFIDIRHSKPTQATSDYEGGKPEMYQAKNKSLEALASDAGTTNCHSKKTHSRSKLKRSSVLLDNTMVRDYNLAIRHFEKLDTRPIQSSSSHNSISSGSSTVSSLFSTSSTTSIRDMLYEGLGEECEEDCAIIDKNQISLEKREEDKARLRIEEDRNTGYEGPRYRRTSLHFD